MREKKKKKYEMHGKGGEWLTERGKSRDRHLYVSRTNCNQKKVQGKIHLHHHQHILPNNHPGQSSSERKKQESRSKHQP